MEKIRIITDSACDIANNDRDDLTIMPIRVSFGDKVYLDGVDISHSEFYDKLSSSEDLPSTSLISPAVYEDEFKKWTDKGEKLIVITLSSKLSSTYQSAVMASESFKGKVAIVDGLNATVGQQVLVKYALELLDSGLEFDKIVARLEEAKHEIRLVGLVDTLEYLKKGGRISKTVALVGGALNIKPVLTIREGAIEMLSKARGTKNGIKQFIAEIASYGDIDFDKPFCVGYTGKSDEIAKCYISDSNSNLRGYKGTVPISTIGATIGTHVGPDAVIIAFFASK